MAVIEEKVKHIERHEQKIESLEKNQNKTRTTLQEKSKDFLNLGLKKEKLTTFLKLAEMDFRGRILPYGEKNRINIQKIFDILYPELSIVVKEIEILPRNQLNENHEWVEDTPAYFIGVKLKDYLS